MSFISNISQISRRLRREEADDFVAWPYLDTLFDYVEMLKNGPISSPIPGGSGQKVAIIGAGVGGMCAAYELLRCGVVPTVFEASDRIGGRAYSKHFTNEDQSQAEAFAEMGSMRVPTSQETFFYYMNSFGLDQTADFPDPGVVQTRLSYENQSYDWSPGSNPPGPFEKIATDFSNWYSQFYHLINPRFANWQEDPTREHTEALVEAWQEILDQFRNITFYTAVQQGIPQWNTECLNAFGALGLGSGGFGPLFSLNMVEMHRVLLQQWEANQRLFTSGMESLPQAFYTEKVEAPGIGTVSLQSQDAVKLGVTIDKVGYDYDTQKPTLTFANGESETFDAVIVATTTRSMSFMDLTLNDDEDKHVLPEKVNVAIRNLHMTESSKLFIRTKTKFWEDENGNDIPNFPVTILTDELPRSVYALSYPDTDNGVILISYVWADDSVRVEAVPPEKRFEIMRDIIYRVAPEWAGELDDPVNGEILNIDWQQEPNYYGAFKLNLPGQEADLVGAYFHFQIVNDPKLDKGVYLAGDGVSWSGGWTEGAIQTGLNAASAVSRRLGGALAQLNPVDGQYPLRYFYGTPPAEVPCGVGIPDPTE